MSDCPNCRHSRRCRAEPENAIWEPYYVCKLDLDMDDGTECPRYAPKPPMDPFDAWAESCARAYFGY